MESTYSSLSLYKLLKEKLCQSSSASWGPSTPSDAHSCTQQTPASQHEKEGPAEPAKHDQADKFSLADLRETLQALDESSVNYWPNSCSECLASIWMGNQQPAKLKPNYYMESWDASQISPRVHIPRKRRRRVEEASYNPGGRAGPARQRKCQIVDLQATDERRQRVTDGERQQIRTSSELLKPVWRVKLPAASPGSSQQSLSMKSHLSSSRKASSTNQETTQADSDTDLSEYDNEIFSILNLNVEAQNDKPTEQNRGEEKTEDVDTKTSQEGAVQRVMGKIKEVEEILRRVSLTSSDWIKEAFEEEDGLTLESSEAYQQVTCWLEDQNRESADEDEELRLLGEAQSLEQTGNMKAGTSGREDQTEMKSTSHSDHFICPSPACLPSHSLSVGEDISPTPSASPSLESLSPILSSPLTTSLTDVRDWQNTEESKRKKSRTISEKGLLDVLEAGGCKRVTTNHRGGGNDAESAEEPIWSTLHLKEEYLLSSGKNDSNTL